MASYQQGTFNTQPNVAVQDPYAGTATATNYMSYMNQGVAQPQPMVGAAQAGAQQYVGQQQFQQYQQGINYANYTAQQFQQMYGQQFGQPGAQSPYSQTTTQPMYNQAAAQSHYTGGMTYPTGATYGTPEAAGGLTGAVDYDPRSHAEGQQQPTTAAEDADPLPPGLQPDDTPAAMAATASTTSNMGAGVDAQNMQTGWGANPWALQSTHQPPVGPQMGPIYQGGAFNSTGYQDPYYQYNALGQGVQQSWTQYGYTYADPNQVAAPQAQVVVQNHPLAVTNQQPQPPPEPMTNAVVAAQASDSAANQAAPVPQVSQTRTDGSGWQTTQSTGMTGTVQPFFIKPNVPKQRARSPMRRAVKTQPADQSPQYTKVPDAAKPSAEPFPGSLKCFAERFFNRYPEKHYPNAPHKLEVLIHDARAKGELWSRNWDAFPLPELDQQPPPAADSVAQNLSSRRERRPNRWSAWTENNETARESHTSTSQRAHSKQGGVNASDRGWAGVEADVSLRDGERVGKSHIIRKARQAFKEDDLDAMQESVSLSNWDNQWEGGRRRGKRGAKRGARAVEHDDDSQPSNDTGYEYKRKGPGSAKRQKVNSKSFPDAEAVKRHRREERFQDTLGDNVLEVKPAKKQNFIHPLSDAREEDFCDVVIKGVSRQLEKSYLRLTSAPDPETVRPEPVLELALARLIKLLGNREVTYLYAGDQLKAIRQDCTVQRIRNHLAVRAYEAAARAALEYGDIAEFNQCQSVLQGLYDEGVEGCVPEFLAYRILYQAVHSALGESRGLRNTLQHMTEQEANDIVVGHALKVMEALQLDDFWSFFELYTKAPNLGRALMDHVLRFKRFGFIKMLAAAFRPSVSVGFLAEALCFYSAAAPGSSSEDGKIPPGCSLVYFPGKAGTKTDVEEGSALCIEWLEKHGAVLEQKTGSARASEVVVNTKLSLSKLYLPEDEEAVAHGDANLGLSDFLAKPTLMA